MDPHQDGGEQWGAVGSRGARVTNNEQEAVLLGVEWAYLFTGPSTGIVIHENLVSHYGLVD